MINPAKTLVAARRLEVVMTAGIGVLIAVALFGLAVGFDAPLEIGQTLARQAGYGAVPLVLWQAWALMAVVAVHLGVWIALLVIARGLFKELAQGNPQTAVRSARMVAYLLWVMLFWGVISQPIASVAATWGYPDGERALSIAFGTPQISVAFAALIASFMAHAFALGAELWQDHQEVV